MGFSWRSKPPSGRTICAEGPRAERRGASHTGRRLRPVDELPRTPVTGQTKRTLLRHTLTAGGAGGR